jgi:hypothetical protein
MKRKEKEKEERIYFSENATQDFSGPTPSLSLPQNPQKRRLTGRHGDDANLPQPIYFFIIIMYSYLLMPQIYGKYYIKISFFYSIWNFIVRFVLLQPIKGTIMKNI